MNDTTVPSYVNGHGGKVLQRLAEQLASLTPELLKAATWVLENPDTIGVSTVRELATGAGVKPNTLVRMARSVGFDGFEDFRQPFRDDIRLGRDSFPDRARWLQSLSRGGKLDGLFADMAADSMGNIEALFQGTDAKALTAAANAIVKARATYVLGVGIAHALARNFSYLADMAVDTITAIPHDGSLPVDDLMRAGSRDVLVAMTFKPYRREVVEAVEVAVEQGVQLIAISDSMAAPILQHARHRFVVPLETPQFFTSTVALTALLETLMVFVIARAGDDVAPNIERFHQRRHELGIYWNAEDS